MDHILGMPSQKVFSTARKQPWRPGNAAKQSKFSSQLFSHKDQGSDSFAMSMPSKTVQTWQASLLTTRSCNAKRQYFNLFGNVDNIIVSWIVMIKYVYIQCFYVLMKFSISVLYHSHQQSMYCIYLLRPYDLPFAGPRSHYSIYSFLLKQKTGCIMLQHLRSYWFKVAITRVEMGSGIPKKKSCRVIVMLKCCIQGGTPWQKQVNCVETCVVCEKCPQLGMLLSNFCKHKDIELLLS